MSFRLGIHGNRKFATLAPFGAALCLVFALSVPGVSGQDAAGGKGSGALKSTPRLADGHPDLNGYWETGANSNLAVVKDGGTTRAVLDLGANPPSKTSAPPLKREPPSVPSYKPEFVDKVKDLGKNSSSKDPAFFCRPLGVPRIGPPHQILQTSKMVVFFYQQDTGSGAAGGIGVRIIPTDGTPHQTDADPSYFGDSIGHWEGDTLVVDVNNFNDDTWMGGGGYIHSDALHVVERVSREGDTLVYQSTAEDPKVLTQPWVLNPRRLKLGSGVVLETPPCDERDEGHLR
jgi:hypothetical protein